MVLDGEMGWLARSTLQASLLLAVLILVRNVVGRHRPARWHYALWLLLLLRMLIPFGPACQISIFNVFHLIPQSGNPSITTDTPLSSDVLVTPSQIVSLVQLWLAGVVLLALYTAWANFRLWSAVTTERLVTDQAVLDLLEDCKEEMGIHTVLGVVETELLQSPALFGFLRPRLLLPPNLIGSFDDKELRHIFLHELAHLKRLDVYVGWLMSVLQILHWFNPLVWYAFHRIRAEREIACDELALSKIGKEDALDYGKTILRLLETFAHTRALPGLAGLLESQSNMKTRIALIARYGPKQFNWSIRTALPILLFAAVALTNSTNAFEPPADSLINERGRLVDNIDLPFVDDPDVIGGWRVVDFVRNPSRFIPGQRQWLGRSLYLKELHFKNGGMTSSGTRWTKGFFINGPMKTASRYIIHRSAAATYMFFEWKTPDYTVRHTRPWWYILQKDSSLIHVEKRTVDRVDYPFVDDPRVRGSWVSVDFVKKIDNFAPGIKSWRGDLYLKGLTFLPNGHTNDKQTIWTKGLLLSKNNQTASRYHLRLMNDVTYMFFEWKSGDYTRRGMKPYYYVLRQTR